MTKRPDCIIHWGEIEAAEPRRYLGDEEEMEIDAAFSPRFGLRRLGIHHVRLLPGHRTSYPHAESNEEEFAYVIDGTPDVWIDGDLHRLKPGDAVGFPAGTGLCHTFLNNTEADVRLLVVGERTRSDNRVCYPLNPEQEATREDWWDMAPERAMGAHDGLPDRVRTLRGGGPKP